MAEEEKIISHAKKAVHVLANKEKKWKEKMVDFLLEIVIIIIAVNITLWFHNWNDKRHEGKTEKEFLIGVREDLMKDTSMLGSYCLRSFQSTMNYYDTVFFQMIMKNKIDKNYINDKQGFLTNTAYFIYNNARYESFKSSGNLKLIENEKLLNDITYLYTIELSVAKENDKELFDNRRKEYDEQIGSKLKFRETGPDDYEQDIASMVNDAAFQYHLARCIILFRERKRMKEQSIQEVRKVILEINKELKDRFDYNVSDKK